ncbi:MAG: O-antigen ligase family protein [Candidatus Synoicihabitans palmerolidicus]|nr:O-antigen ligase family protein [Candidatus Synoicihabitans palmerolidicus]
MAVAVLDTDNRAAMLALAVGCAWMIIAGRWRFTAAIGLVAILGVVGTLWIARITNTPWQNTPLLGLYEKTVSIIDPSGHRAYRGAETFNKGDNNRYRLVWWQLVARETIETNPYTGLGFGHDLSKRFMQNYYGNVAADYAVRSPHSILMIVFARMGLVGLLPFLGIIALMARETWRVLRPELHPSLGFWLGAWVILITAFLGVVLEGPMGVVVFWLLLGIANGLVRSEPAITDANPQELPA